MVVQPLIICPPPPMDSDPSALFFATLFMCLEPPISGKAVVPMKSLGRTPWSARLPGFCWRFSATGRLKGRSTAFALPLENIDGGASRWTTGLFRLLAWGGDPREASLVGLRRIRGPQGPGATGVVRTALSYAARDTVWRYPRAGGALACSPFYIPVYISSVIFGISSRRKGRPR